MAIVIVDDTIFSLEVIKAFLIKEGYLDVIPVNSAKELYELVDGYSERGIIEIDLILMDFIKKPLERVELVARVRSALRLKHETARRKARETELLEVTRQLQAANERLKHLTFQDGLTGIANRRHFDEELLQESLRAKRDKTPLSLIMLDIDYFKAFNDTYGHLKGDDCLKIVTSILMKTLKRPADLLARYGGEEFAVVLPNTGEAGAVLLAEKLRANIENAGILHINSLCADYVTVSLGVVTRCSEQEDTPDNMILA